MLTSLLVIAWGSVRHVHWYEVLYQAVLGG
jgi:hypothetical protein